MIKYNGTTLYRIENGFQYDDIHIFCQTMANWVIACSERYLEAVYERLKAHLLEETNLHVDGNGGTGIAGIRPGRPKSYEWHYRTGFHARRSIIVYEYRETRSQEHLKAFQKGYGGLLHCGWLSGLSQSAAGNYGDRLLGALS